MTLSFQSMILSGRGVTAVLGPTNTGKTHYAIERMVAHDSGVIGLPLRLLAREVYTRLVEKVGHHNVALITGEEKIAPHRARYSVCTVEAMPRETTASFVAIDEVQLAGDLERGHIFTDRLLHLRGRGETLLLGAATMRPILEHLLPGITVVERPRMSQLLYAGSKKITRLPHRSAIVAFSADEVYAIAELIRRQRGGAAVVLGALSPRTRNAQVALYQEGDVDYLVATDAIGMGLNLDVDHVAFAQDRKFDGYQYRNLNPAELAQVAGRAGRHVRDGTFGVTGRVDPFEDELVQRIESHEFDPVRVLQWRSKAVDYSSLKALKHSLEAAPAVSGLTRALPAVDQQALEHLARYPEVVDVATTSERVEKLWEACALPDYRRIAPAQHADLIASIYADLVRHGTVNEDFMAEQVRRADHTDGEIDTLSARIAQIRTWTYVSNRPGWLADPTHWQEKTREIEDRLSDALHERLTKRFVDRRTSVLMKRLRENAMLEAEISVNGDVFVEGHHVGQLTGFRFTLVAGSEGTDAKAVQGAAQKALALEFEARAARLHAAGNNDLALSSDGLVRWLGDPVARLAASDHVMRPRVILLADEQLTANARDHVVARIERYVNHHISTVLKPLDDISRAEDLEGLAKGLAFQIVENLGVLFRRDVAEEVKSLDQESRASIRKYGVRFGAYHIFLPALLKPAPAELITLLWALKNDGLDKPGYGELIPILAAGRTSVVTDPSFERTFYKLAGFRYLGKRAVRIDILERLADLIRPLLQWKPGTTQRPEGAYDGRRFTATTSMLSILGATPDDMEEILKGLGYRADSVTAEEAAAFLAKQDGTPAEASAAPEAATEHVEADADDAAEPSDADAAPAETASTQAELAEAAPTEAAPAEAGGEEAPAAAQPEEPAEPKPVLLWRPGTRQDNQRGGRHQQGDQRRGGQRHGQGEAREGGRKGGAPGRAKPQDGKPGGQRKERQDRHERHDRAVKFDNRPPRKEKPIDPDSPFAKLAALKEQLKK
ncbi:ATP-dependent DNA and RNA helicase protein [Sinorhizobium fredii NGR234]|uniref:ATP-dependent DNA and RNA helicase protein n=2 Tax=Rhizobium fredii TaxID=380 RepID=C3MAK8_SINFN|nr:ATP-dependent DNA and RNA helicase protein [Sinorhizobium fredii NGR234]